MKITGITKWNRRAQEIHYRQFSNHLPSTKLERENIVSQLLQIADLASFTSRIIEAGCVSLKNDLFIDDGDEMNPSYISDVGRSEGGIWTKAGKDRIRLTNVGIALIHDIYAVPDYEGGRFPRLEELGFKQNFSFS